MLILNCPSKLQLLEGLLRRSLPHTLPAYGVVMHINRGNPAQHEVVVDSWPEVKAVLTRPRQEVVKDNLDYYANIHAAFYWDIDACQALLGNVEAIDWGRAFQLYGFQDGMYEATKGIVETKHLHLETYVYQTLMHPDPSTLHPSWLSSDDFHLGILSPSQATLLNDAWDFGGNHRSLRYLDSLIRCFPSACLLDKAGQLISWSLSDSTACLTHGYTLPQYRGQGCVRAVTQAIAGKLYSRGFPVYCGVLAENQPSKQALVRMGFHILPETYYTLVVTPALNLQS